MFGIPNQDKLDRAFKTRETYMFETLGMEETRLLQIDSFKAMAPILSKLLMPYKGSTLDQTL